MVGPTPDDWSVDPAATEVWEVVPGLQRLRLPMRWEGIGHTNAFLLEAEAGPLLIDCGTGGHQSCWDALVHGIETAGHRLSEVRALVATHAHTDHVGLAWRVLEETGAELWMHPHHGHLYDALREPRRIERARERRALAEGVPPEAVRPYRTVAEEVEAVMAPVEPDRGLVNGVRIPSAVGEWEILETPGHAPSHVSLWEPEQRICIVGDLLGAVYAPFFDYGYTRDPVAELLASLDRLAGLEIRMAIPGHGRPLEDPGAVVEDHRRRTTERADAVAAAVAEGPVHAFELTRRVFGEPPDEIQAVWQFSQVICFLKHLREVGRVTRGVAADGTFHYSCISDRGSGPATARP